MAAEEIFKHCWSVTCRKDTLHRRVPGISTKSLYKCTGEGCTAAAREVSEDLPRMPAEITAQASGAKKTADRKERAKIQSVSRGRTSPAPRERKTMAKAIQNVTVTVNTAPLKKAIEEIVDAKLKSIGQEVLGEVTSVIESILSDRKARILKVDKSDLQLEERRSVSGQKVTKEMCKRGSHPGRHSARCLEAASK